jgi:hypothetical protein
MILDVMDVEPDCRTNHDIAYARSKDLVNWETVAGQTLKLPITPANKDVIVDPIPTMTGLINVSYGLGFDAQKRPIVHYHNYDKNGYSQIYLARWENGVWNRRQATDWEYRWNFHGGGCVEVDLHAGPVRALRDGRLIQNWRHRKYGQGTRLVDSGSLKAGGSYAMPSWFPKELRSPQSDFKAIPMEVHWRGAHGKGEPGVRCFLRWETLPVNRDRARQGPLPKPGMLRMYRVALQPM